MWPIISYDIMVEGVVRGDAVDIAEIHAAAFDHRWSADEMLRLIDSDNVRALKCRRPSTLFRPASRRPRGFVMARLAADEAEILTIAVARDARRLGLGKLLMQAIIDDLYADGFRHLFLEVDEANEAAVALYRQLGFEQVGERKSYYAPAKKAGPGATERPRALVMRVNLR